MNGKTRGSLVKPTIISMQHISKIDKTEIYTLQLSLLLKNSHKFDTCTIHVILFIYEDTQSFSFMKIHTITDESPQHISLKKKAMQPPCEVRISVSCTTSASLHITAPSSSSRESIKIISPISAAPSNLSV